MEILGFVIPTAWAAGVGPYMLAGAAGMAFLEAVARVTPNETDNKIMVFAGKLVSSLNIRKK